MLQRAPLPLHSFADKFCIVKELLRGELQGTAACSDCLEDHDPVCSKVIGGPAQAPAIPPNRPENHVTISLKFGRAPAESLDAGLLVGSSLTLKELLRLLRYTAVFS
eukprot:gnl/TRDRNA2_/TRDRNA2_159111_c0_seq5.p2 gnl/TRDRNA2_/TRDRNA2_159111_c0~~gnl/TRDRNA2_/TRDRNA2_159111_c0_seq5.p2  ORF type:complete len:107 (-),score=12.71 gnl/TRDRNA2_/TRDRNA2_159111_c0_seq5:4-324(-)